MAEAVLEVVLGNLSSLIQKELGMFLGADQEMRRLSSTLTSIKAVLEDAEDKHITNSALKDWLRKLQDAAYLLDDILDECSTKALARQYRGHKVHCSGLSSFHPNHVLFRHKIARKMKDIRVRLDEIAEERLKFHLRETVIERKNEIKEWRQTTSIITRSHVYGREEDKETVVDFLVDRASSSEYVSVYPIVGIGGLGKTTLAQLVFNDERIVSHFELKIWVCVSEDFSLKRMSKAIIESASGHACEDLELDPLQRRLQEMLGRKRYLLVLDDVWNDNQEIWEKLKYVLACGSRGSSILITTRLTKVASIMGTMPPHWLSILSDDDCWELFKQRAFGQDKAERAELVAIGKEIVKKCKGVPLAAKAMGSLLYFKNEEKDWLYVKGSQIWSLSRDEYPILPALRLSYLNLAPKLRRCFAYCALFPKDHRMSKKLVIELWMANGFISSSERLEVEDDGEGVWNELYLRSFFQDVETDLFGYNTWFKMHDLIHDLAQSIMEEEYCCISNHNGASNLSSRTRHISIYCNKPFDGCTSQHLQHVNSLKAYINQFHEIEYLPVYMLMKCYSLRLLDIKYLKEVSSSIGYLKHLRYLNLSSGTFKTLPNSICRLWNLQILNLNYCQHLQKLPNRLKCLKSLRHLQLEGCRSLSSLPPEMGQLTSLKTLNTFIVGKEKGFMLAELGHLNLNGRLYIKHMERVRSVMDAKEANFANKHLIELALSWERNEESQLQENVEQILEVLQPHLQLQILLVGGYIGTKLPQWIDDPTLKDLHLLELVDCEYILRISPLDNLPSLKNLKLSNMNLVQYVDDESYDGGVARGFKALEFLLLDKLPNLVRLSKVDGENMFPRLSTLQISHCPKLSLPSLASVTKLKVILGGCSQVLLGSIQNLHNLECLWFIKDKKLSSFPDGMLRGLTCLKELHIYKLDNLEVLPTELCNLNALEELHIGECNNLETLTEEALQGLHSLRRLKICGYAKFKLCAGFQYLTSLEDLIVASCPEVDGFPEALQHLTTLQSLSLYDLPNLAVLPNWLGNLRSLKSLLISKCPKLISLPMSIQCLSSLENLEIWGCSELQKRCEKEKGEDWHKIAHISRTRLEEGFFQPDGFGYSLYHLEFKLTTGQAFAL